MYPKHISEEVIELKGSVQNLDAKINSILKDAEKKEKTHESDIAQLKKDYEEKISSFEYEIHHIKKLIPHFWGDVLTVVIVVIIMKWLHLL